MPDQLRPHQQPEENSATEQAEREAVCADHQAARHELAGECSEALNETPEGRLQLMAAQGGLDLLEQKRTELLELPQVWKFCKRPLPLPIPSPILEACLSALRTHLEADSAETEREPESVGGLQEAVATAETREEEIDQATAKAETSVEEIDQASAAAETHEAGLNRAITQTEAERDAETKRANTNAAKVQQVIKNIPAGNLAHYRAQTTKILSEQYEGQELRDIQDVAEAEFAKHEARLNAMQAVFTPEEVKSIFGGSLAKTVSLNLRGENKAEIYADVFAQIDAGIMDDDRRKEVRAQVEGQLGIKPHLVDVDSGGDANDVFKRGYGTETYVDENGELQERNIPLGPEFEVEFREGQRLGVNENGQKYASILNDAGRFRVILPDNPSDNDIGQYIRAAQMRAQFHHMNAAQAFYPGVDDFELSGGTMVLRTPQDFVVTDNLERILIGHETLAGNDIFSESELSQIPYLLQFHSGKGDYIMGDVNPEQMQADLKAQGVMNEDNTINWDRFETLVQANRGRYTTQQNYVRNHEDQAA